MEQENQPKPKPRHMSEINNFKDISKTSGMQFFFLIHLRMQKSEMDEDYDGNSG